MRGSIAHVYAFVLAAVALAAGTSSCSRSWVLPGSEVDASALGGHGDGGAASGGATGAAGAHGSGGWGFGGFTGAAGAHGSGGFGASGSGGCGAFGSSGCGAFGGSGFAVGTGGGSACSPIDFKKHAATVMFVVGRNFSMSTKFRDGPSRLDAVREAIDTALRTPTGIAYGYQDFPALGGCTNQGLCCLNKYAGPSTTLTPSKFDLAFAPCTSSGSGDACFAMSNARPVEMALQNVITNFNPTPDSSWLDPYVVLFVDGAPGCLSGGASSDCMDEPDTVAGLASKGTKVYVVAIGDDAIGDPCLKNMANTVPGMTFLLPATDQKTLTSQLNSITHAAAQSACTLDLFVGERPPENTVHIRVMGTELPRDPSKTNGWAYTGTTSTRIKVYGEAACMMLLEAGPDVHVYGWCPPP